MAQRRSCTVVELRVLLAQRRLVYAAPQPAYHAVREQPNETNDKD